MSEIELRDAILRHSLQLLRLSAGNEAEAEAILIALERDLKALLQSQALSEATKAEIRALIAEADKAILASYSKAGSVVDTQGLAVIVAEKTVGALEDALPFAIATPTPERLASLTKDVLIDGAPSSAWWARQAEDTAFRFAAAVRQGVINGETNEQIVRRVAGGRDGPGLMTVARHNARALVNTSIQTAANDARLAVYRKNSRLIAGVRWLATFDSHTCRRCAALDGQSWTLEGKKRKGTTVDFITPQAHFNCRCQLSAVPKTFRELGIDIDEPLVGERASSEGPIAATTTMDEFLKRQPASFVERTLGKKRAEMFLAGKLTLRDLVSGSGRELTLEELAKII